MSTYTASFPNCDLKTDAGFRQLVTHIKDVMDNVNSVLLFKTADTGQIDPLTVTTPFVSDATVHYGGYNIYKFEDSIKDIYIKIYYGVYGNSVSTSLCEYVLKVELGTGTDGSGSITGLFHTTTLRALPGTSAQGITSRGIHNSYACVKDGFVALCFEVGAVTSTGATPYPNSTLSTESHTLIISRQGSTNCFLISTGNGFEKDTDAYGSATEKVRPRDLTTFVVDLTPGIGLYSQIVKTKNWSGFIPGTSGAIGADIGVLRVQAVSHTDIYKDKNLLMYWGGDFSHATQMTVDIDGVSSNFLFLKPSLRTCFPYMNIAIRWE